MNPYGMLAPSPLSFLLILLLVVTTGTAWFAAIHPGFIRSVLQGDVPDDPACGNSRALRIGGILFGAAGFLLLVIPDLF